MPTIYNFSDVFVSYSRKDSDFVRRLTDALAARDYESWVDWEDIPHTADWWAEIQAGIDAADTFLFVISPDSSQSSVCRDEVEYATQSNKRIVPILRKDLEEAQVESLHPTLRTHNWLVFTADDKETFTEKLQQLIKVLMTDLEHVRNHTRYLVRAREWEQNGKDASYLLRGAYAEAALDWLDASKEKQPAVLPLHQSYLLACSQQLKVDEEIEQQRIAVQFIERRTWPAFFIGLFIGSIYCFYTFPSPDAAFEWIHRLGFALGAGAAFGIFLAAISLYADELNQVRFHDQPRLRVLSSVMYCLLFGSVGFGLMQVVYFGARLDYITLLAAGLGIALIFLVRAVFHTRGVRGFIIGALMLFGLIPLFSATPDAGWPEGRLPIFLFENVTQQFWLTVLLAIGISLSITSWELFHPFYSAMKQRRRQAQAELRYTE